MSDPVFKQEFYLKADNEHESVQDGLLSFANFSRSGVQVLKRDRNFKAIEFLSFQLPFSANDEAWVSKLSALIDSESFKAFTVGTDKHFSISDASVTLVPTSLFSDEHKDLNMQLLHGQRENVLLVTQELANTAATGMFALPKALTTLSTEPLRSSYFHWLERIQPSSLKVQAHLVLETEQFALAIFRDGKLIFSNWFSYRAPADILYYLMAALESLKILHSEIDVVVGGKIDKDDQVHSALKRYISKLSFAKRPANLTYSYSFKELPEHRFPFIFSAACA